MLQRVEWLAVRWLQVLSGVSEERVEQAGSVLDAREPVLLYRDQFVQAPQQVAQAAFDVR
jgi:hypothetical protein